MQLKVGISLFLLAFSLAERALPSPIQYVLQNTTFSDGGTASGVFTIDPDTGILSQWNITTTRGSLLPGFTYTQENSVSDLPFGTRVAVLSYEQFPNPINGNLASFSLRLNFASPLTNAGGTFQISGNSVECYNCQPLRSVTGGTVFGPVPEPGTLGLLLLTTLAGGGLFRGLERSSKRQLKR